MPASCQPMWRASEESEPAGAGTGWQHRAVPKSKLENKAYLVLLAPLGAVPDASISFAICAWKIPPSSPSSF